MARISIDCPHCKGKTAVRSSRAVTDIYKHLNYQCQNLECGHTFACALEFLYTISPSATPNPDVHLRVAPPRAKQVAANDVDGATPPAVVEPAYANDNSEGALSALCGPGVPPGVAANLNDSISEAVNTGS